MSGSSFGFFSATASTSTPAPATCTTAGTAAATFAATASANSARTTSGGTGSGSGYLVVSTFDHAHHPCVSPPRYGVTIQGAIFDFHCVLRKVT